MIKRQNICAIARLTAQNRARHDEELQGRIYDALQAAGYRVIDANEAWSQDALIDAMAEAAQQAENAYFRPVA